MLHRTSAVLHATILSGDGGRQNSHRRSSPSQTLGVWVEGVEAYPVAEVSKLFYRRTQRKLTSTNRDPGGGGRDQYMR